jgi:hypothetical protein
MARTNIKAGRADRRGAARVAAFVGVTQLASAWLVMAHVPALGEAMLLLASVAWPLMAAAGAWILYIALEPTVRRSWPSALIGWNRLLDGRIRDARVAGDVLIGMAAGGFLYGALDSALYAMLPLPPQGLDAQSWLAAGSLRNTIAMLVNSVDSSLFLAFTLLLVFCVLRFALRRDTIAAIAFALLFTVLTLLSLGAAATSGGEFRTAFVIGYGLSYGAAFVVVLVRCGLVAVMACFVSGSLLSFVMTLDPSGPYSGPSFFGLVTVVLIAIAAAWTCRAAHRLGVRASIARPSFESTS